VDTKIIDGRQLTEEIEINRFQKNVVKNAGNEIIKVWNFLLHTFNTFHTFNFFVNLRFRKFVLYDEFNKTEAKERFDP